MSQAIQFDAELIRRYDRSGPRYTSYPTALQFHPDFERSAYRSAALLSNAQVTPLSIYVHVPFCMSPCFYCGCNKVITRSNSEGQRYVAALQREIEMQATLFHAHRHVEQLHFGGGTPTFLSTLQLQAVMQTLRKEFNLQKDGAEEYSIEIDPRTIGTTTIAELARLGFNRISLGVQDFDANVQAAVNRVQSVGDTLRVLEQARRCGITAVSFDLIYGLPRQTLESFARTLATVVQARPSRVAVYGYAHLPAIFKPQRRINPDELPSAAQRLDLLELSIEKLSAAGYLYIGMDHFALPEDPLALARAQGSLHRNFQGYSSHAQCDLVGLGVSAISKVGAAYAQNLKKLSDYYAAIDHGELAIERGVKLSSEDRIRADVIQQLMCSGVVDCAAVERDHCIEFDNYFAAELLQLAPMLAEGLLEELGARIVISDKGRLLVRSIAMIFDAYLKPQSLSAYSKVL